MSANPFPCNVASFKGQNIRNEYILVIVCVTCSHLRFCLYHDIESAGCPCRFNQSRCLGTEVRKTRVQLELSLLKVHLNVDSAQALDLKKVLTSMLMVKWKRYSLKSHCPCLQALGLLHLTNVISSISAVLLELFVDCELIFSSSWMAERKMLFPLHHSPLAYQLLIVQDSASEKGRAYVYGFLSVIWNGI